MLKLNFLDFHLCPSSLFLLLGTTEKSLAVFFTGSHHIRYPFFKVKKIMALLASPQHLCGLSLASFCPCLSCTGEVRPGHSTPHVLSAWMNREESPPSTCWKWSSECSWGCCRPSLLQGHTTGSCSTWFPWGTPGPFLQSCFTAGQPHHVWVHEVLSTQGEYLAFPYVEVQHIPVRSFLQPVKLPLNNATTFWCIRPSFPLRIIYKLAEGVPSSSSLAKILSITGPTIDPWATSLVTALQVDLCSWPQPFEPETSHNFQSTWLFISVMSPSVCLEECIGGLCQKPSWSQGKQHPMLSPHPLNQSSYCGWLAVWLLGSKNSK